MMPFKVVYQVFPPGLHGIICGGVERRKNGYIILIDSLLTDEEKDHTLRHELSHIILNHFEDVPEDADHGFFCRSETQEAEAEEYANSMTDAELESLMQLAV